MEPERCGHGRPVMFGALRRDGLTFRSTWVLLGATWCGWILFLLLSLDSYIRRAIVQLLGNSMQRNSSKRCVRRCPVADTHLLRAR